MKIILMSYQLTLSDQSYSALYTQQTLNASL